MLILKEEDFIGKGSERACYLHPEDKNKAVKVTYKNNKREKNKQSQKEVDYYNELIKRGMNDWQHLPKFYGRNTD